MLQICTKWQLWDLPNGYKEEIKEIKLRGYSKDEPVALTGEIVFQINESSLKSLSVGDIVGYCPTYRDLFLKRKKKKKGVPTWGRIAGPLIEDYCKGIINKHGIFEQKVPLTYKTINTKINAYTKAFIQRHKKQFKELKGHEKHPEDDIKRFSLHLEYTARYELAMLSANNALSGQDRDRSKLLLERLSISSDGTKISPKSEIIGIKAPSTPDFLMAKLGAVGDVKSAKAFKRLYYLTCTGYALAYESEHGKNSEINFGLIYFFETHTRRFGFANSCAFVIDDELRTEFLDRRNRAFYVLLSDTPPKFANEEEDCNFCKHKDTCAKDRNGTTD